MKELLDFILLAVFFGPVGSIPYGLTIMSSLEIYIILTILYIAPIPVIFKLFEYGGHHRRFYRRRIFRKVSDISGKRIEDLVDRGDKITDMFEKKMGHLGLYATIVLLTLILGVFWASLFSYIMMVKRRRAIYSMTLGVIIGNTFWVLVINHFRKYMTLEVIILILLLVPVWIYGLNRELEILKKVAKRLDLVKD